tara:strand:- start:644 stop:820 length:177 start_codon:yes stop_codon:yes gene_type:complete
MNPKQKESLCKILIKLFVSPLIVMLVWNAVIPGIFGLTTLGYWSAMGLYVVCSILFGK